MKIRHLNLWFTAISKKKCPSCESKEGTVYGWYEYTNAKRRLIKHICTKCVLDQALPMTLAYLNHSANTNVRSISAPTSGSDFDELLAKLQTVLDKRNGGTNADKDSNNA